MLNLGKVWFFLFLAIYFFVVACFAQRGGGAGMVSIASAYGSRVFEFVELLVFEAAL